MIKISQRRKKKFFSSFFFFFLLFSIIATCFLFYLSGYPQKVISLYLESKELMEHSTIEDFKQNQEGEVYDKNNNLIALLRDDKTLIYLNSEKIPEEVREAFISIEDKRFYKHHGFDPVAIVRALSSFLSKSSITQGGSTITQQLSRNIYLTHTVKWERKVEEIFIAIQLEKKYSKEEILEFYINNIYFSNGCYGIQAASRGYFSKDVSELSLGEIAFLCAIPNNPSLYDPLKHKENTLKRQELILLNMYEDGYISKTEYETAKAEEITLNPYQANFKRTWAHAYIYECATRALMDITQTDYETAHDLLYNGGYRIYTSIDLDVQAFLQQCIDEELADYNTMNNNGSYALQGAATCIDNDTGLVTAIVGGRSQEGISVDYNRAFLSFRQPGSAIKPLIVYTPMLERGYSANSTVIDKKEKDGPENAGRYLGSISLRTAVEQSKNTVAYKLFRELTPEVGISYLLNMNFSEIQEEDYNLSAALGGFTKGVSSLEMAAGYATLENEGLYRLPSCITMITDMEGNILSLPEKETMQVYEPSAAREMTDILKGVLTRGTAKGNAIPNMPCAGKTGTTNDNIDGWFVGYSAYYTTSVWVGFDAPRGISEIAGSNYPVHIWNQFMTGLHAGLPSRALNE